MVINVYKLGKEDLEEYKRLRLWGLKAHPESFGRTYEEESRLSDEEFLARIGLSNMMGAYDESQTPPRLVGLMGYLDERLLEKKEEVKIVAVVIDENYRASKGVTDHQGRSVLQALFDGVKTDVKANHPETKKILVDHYDNNFASGKSYPKLGFEFTHEGAGHTPERKYKFYEYRLN